MEMRGRGCWHQIDAFGAPLSSPPFMYPLRLLVEAKCYDGRPVDVRTVRAVVGTVMDISQNFFIERIQDFDVQMQRYNYAAAIFSVSDYTAAAQQFAAAHQIFLIDYKDVPAMRPVVDVLFALRPEDFGTTDRWNIHVDVGEMRRSLRILLSGELDEVAPALGLNGSGQMPVWANLIPVARAIQGSYYGMIVYGIPFSVIPFKGRPVKKSEPDDRPKNHVRALPERVLMAIRFPVVEAMPSP